MGNYTPDVAFLAGVRWADSHPRDIWALTCPGLMRNEEARKEATRHAANTATLAQNTQGDAVAYRVLSPGGKKWIYKTAPLNVDAFRDAGMQIDPLYLHAERARVPEGWALVPIKPTQQMLDAMGACEYPLNAWDEALAAAPSQRAEVKS